MVRVRYTLTPLHDTLTLTLTLSLPPNPNPNPNQAILKSTMTRMHAELRAEQRRLNAKHGEG